MNNFRGPQILRTITIFVMVLGILILAFSGFLTPISRIILNPLISLQGNLAERFRAVQDFISAPREVNELLQENARLESEVSQLQTQIIELQQQLTEYQILTALLDFARANPEYQYVGASVIQRDPNPFFQYVIINRGSDDGILRGMPVVTQQGLVGRIANTTAGASRVQLLTDPASNINVRLQPSGAEGVLTGSITGDVNLGFIPQEENIQPGDLVLTSGFGGNYPSDIIIGQVTGIRSQDFDLFQSGSVQPVVDFSELDIVLVIRNFQPVDISPLVP